MNILVTADWHLSENPRDEYRHRWVQETLPALIKQHGIETVLLLGDLTDAKDRHSAWLVNRVVSYIGDISHNCLISIVRGNHDYMDVDNPFFEFTKRIRNVSWIGSPRRIGDWLFLPHTRNHEKDWAEVDFSDVKRIFTHNTFDGAVAEGGRELRGLPLDAVLGIATISGDVHVPQKLGPVTYVGAPYSIDFGDSFKPRVLLINSNKVTSIRSPGIQKRLLEVTWPEGDFQIFRKVRSPKGSYIYDDNPFKAHRISKFNKDDIVKVVVGITQEQAARWNEIRDQVREWGQTKGFLIYAVVPEVRSATGGKTLATRSHRRKQDDVLLREYAARANLDQLTLKAGLNLLKRG